MNFQVSDSNVGFTVALAAAAGLVTPIFWMVVGWRAMRAHERIADRLAEVLERE